MCSHISMSFHVVLAAKPCHFRWLAVILVVGFRCLAANLAEARL
jgi:hypothetical protein